MVVMDFSTAFERVIGHEGVFDDSREDRGNWTGGRVGVGELRGTRYGISAAAYPQLNIRALTLEEARAIYRRDYWSRIRADELPVGVRFDLFDLAVNSGVTASIRVLQRAVGVAVDGVIGPVTLAMARSLDQHRLARRIAGHRLLLMTDAPTWGVHGRGWARRVAANLLADEAAT